MFKVGDLVKCNTNGKYLITTPNVLCIVVKVCRYENCDSESDMRIKIVDYNNPEVCLNDYNSSYWVESQFFDKVE